MILIIGIAFMFVSRQMGAANKSMDFGKSRAKMNEKTSKITFKKCSGINGRKRRSI